MHRFLCIIKSSRFRRAPYDTAQNHKHGVNHLIASDGYIPRISLKELLDATAALADAWSTVAMLMKKDELSERAASETTVYVEQDKAIVQL